MRSATSSSGTSNFGSWVSTHSTVRASTSVPRQVAVRPLDDDLVGVGEALRRGEGRAGVADRDPVAEERPDPGDGGGEVDGAEDDHARRRGERVHEDGDVVAAPLAVGPVVHDPVLPCSSMPAHVVAHGVVEALRAEAAVRAVGRGPPAACRAGSSSPATRVATATGTPPRRPRRSSPSSGKVSRLTRSTKMSMMPPQVRPDRERVVVADRRSAAAGATRRRATALGELVDRALDAAARHAADDGAVRARPAWRRRAGAARTSRCRRRSPSPTVSPARHQVSSSLSTSRMHDHLSHHA